MASSMTVHMIGNAHLDPVWLWHWQRGSDEALATCRSACDLLDQYPEVTFTRGEAWVYEQVRTRDEALFRRICSHVEAGRWEVTGGWYVQADTNIPTEEALTRNIEMGHAWFRRHMGIPAIPVAYLPDSFGHGPYLPRILSRAGQRYFVFMRPNCAEMELSASLFRWRSPDGEEVLAARIAQYLAAGPDLSQSVVSAVDQAMPEAGHALCFYGVGDHGGGPTRAAIEWILAHQDFAPDVRLEFSSVRRYFEAVEPRRDGCPVVIGELRPHAVGCYSVCGALKRDVRSAEQAAADAHAMLRTAGNPPAECSEVDAAWEAICFNQFHDVVTGTAIREAIDVSRRQVGEAQNRIDRVFHRLTREHARLVAAALAGHRLHVVNRSRRAWSGLADCEIWFGWDEWDHHLQDAAGRAVPFQLVRPASVVREEASGITPILRLLFPVALGPHEAVTFKIAPGPGEWTLSEAQPRFEAGVLENGLLRVSFGDGGIEQIRGFDGASGGILAAPLELRAVEDHTDTWAHGVDRFDGGLLGVARFGPPELIENGPLLTTVRMTGGLLRSRMALFASVVRGEPVLHLALMTNYAEPLSVLKAAIALTGPVPTMRHRVSGGWCDRPADGGEYPLHHALLVGGAAPVGLALPDSFAISAEPGLLQPTLIRNNVNGVHISRGLEDAMAQELCQMLGTDEGPQVIRLSVAIGDAASEERLEGLLDWLQRPVQVWDDFHGISRVHHVEPPPVESGPGTG